MEKVLCFYCQKAHLDFSCDGNGDWGGRCSNCGCVTPLKSSFDAVLKALREQADRKLEQALSILVEEVEDARREVKACFNELGNRFLQLAKNSEDHRFSELGEFQGAMPLLESKTAVIGSLERIIARVDKLSSDKSVEVLVACKGDRTVVTRAGRRFLREVEDRSVLKEIFEGGNAMSLEALAEHISKKMNRTISHPDLLLLLEDLSQQNLVTRSPGYWSVTSEAKELLKSK